MFFRTPPTVVRLSVRPDVPVDMSYEGPPAVTGRRRGLRQPYADSVVQRVRHLIENTTLSQLQIAAKVGVKRATISVWQKNYGWTRPAFAPKCPSNVPAWRAGPGLKLRLLTGRLVAIAERMVRELEDAQDTDLDKLVQALQVIRMARATMLPNRRRPFLIGRPRTGYETMKEEESIRAALRELHRNGVTIDQAPQEAVDLVIEANTPLKSDIPAPKPPKVGGRSRK